MDQPKNTALSEDWTKGGSSMGRQFGDAPGRQYGAPPKKPKPIRKKYAGPRRRAAEQPPKPKPSRTATIEQASARKLPTSIVDSLQASEWGDDEVAQIASSMAKQTDLPISTYGAFGVYTKVPYADHLWVNPKTQEMLTTGEAKRLMKPQADFFQKLFTNAKYTDPRTGKESQLNPYLVSYSYKKLSQFEWADKLPNKQVVYLAAGIAGTLQGLNEGAIPRFWGLLDWVNDASDFRNESITSKISMAATMAQKGIEVDRAASISSTMAVQAGLEAKNAAQAGTDPGAASPELNPDVTVANQVAFLRSVDDGAAKDIIERMAVDPNFEWELIKSGEDSSHKYGSLAEQKIAENAYSIRQAAITEAQTKAKSLGWDDIGDVDVFTFLAEKSGGTREGELKAYYTLGFLRVLGSGNVDKIDALNQNYGSAQYTTPEAPASMTEPVARDLMKKALNGQRWDDQVLKLWAENNKHLEDYLADMKYRAENRLNISIPIITPAVSWLNNAAGKIGAVAWSIPGSIPTVLDGLLPGGRAIDEIPEGLVERWQDPESTENKFWNQGVAEGAWSGLMDMGNVQMGLFHGALHSGSRQLEGLGNIFLGGSKEQKNEINKYLDQELRHDFVNSWEIIYGDKTFSEIMTGEDLVSITEDREYLFNEYLDDPASLLTEFAVGYYTDPTLALGGYMKGAKSLRFEEEAVASNRWLSTIEGQWYARRHGINTDILEQVSAYEQRMQQVLSVASDWRYGDQVLKNKTAAQMISWVAVHDPTSIDNFEHYVVKALRGRAGRTGFDPRWINTLHKQITRMSKVEGLGEDYITTYVNRWLATAFGYEWDEAAALTITRDGKLVPIVGTAEEFGEARRLQLGEAAVSREKEILADQVLAREVIQLNEAAKEVMETGSAWAGARRITAPTEAARVQWADKLRRQAENRALEFNVKNKVEVPWGFRDDAARAESVKAWKNMAAITGNLKEAGPGGRRGSFSLRAAGGYVPTKDPLRQKLGNLYRKGAQNTLLGKTLRNTGNYLFTPNAGFSVSIEDVPSRIKAILYRGTKNGKTYFSDDEILKYSEDASEMLFSPNPERALLGLTIDLNHKMAYRMAESMGLRPLKRKELTKLLRDDAELLEETALRVENPKTGKWEYVLNKKGEKKLDPVKVQELVEHQEYRTIVRSIFDTWAENMKGTFAILEVDPKIERNFRDALKSGNVDKVMEAVDASNTQLRKMGYPLIESQLLQHIMFIDPVDMREMFENAIGWLGLMKNHINNIAKRDGIIKSAVVKREGDYGTVVQNTGDGIHVIHRDQRIKDSKFFSHLVSENPTMLAAWRNIGRDMILRRFYGMWKLSVVISGRYVWRVALMDEQFRYLAENGPVETLGRFEGTRKVLEKVGVDTGMGPKEVLVDMDVFSNREVAAALEKSPFSTVSEALEAAFAYRRGGRTMEKGVAGLATTPQVATGFESLPPRVQKMLLDHLDAKIAKDGSAITAATRGEPSEEVRSMMEFIDKDHAAGETARGFGEGPTVKILVDPGGSRESEEFISDTLAVIFPEKSLQRILTFSPGSKLDQARWREFVRNPMANVRASVYHELGHLWNSVIPATDKSLHPIWSEILDILKKFDKGTIVSKDGSVVMPGFVDNTLTTWANEVGVDLSMRNKQGKLIFNQQEIYGEMYAIWRTEPKMLETYLPETAKAFKDSEKVLRSLEFRIAGRHSDEIFQWFKAKGFKNEDLIGSKLNAPGSPFKKAVNRVIEPGRYKTTVVTPDMHDPETYIKPETFSGPSPDRSTPNLVINSGASKRISVSPTKYQQHELAKIVESNNPRKMTRFVEDWTNEALKHFSQPESSNTVLGYLARGMSREEAKAAFVKLLRQPQNDYLRNRVGVRSMGVGLERQAENEVDMVYKYLLEDPRLAEALLARDRETAQDLFTRLLFEVDENGTIVRGKPFYRPGIDEPKVNYKDVYDQPYSAADENFTLHGPEWKEEATKRSRVWDWLTRWTFSEPTNRANRVPFYRSKNKRFNDQMSKMLANAGIDITDPRTAANIEMAAADMAAKATNDIMFDFRNQTRFGELLNFVFPFFQPQTEAFMVYGRLAKKNPRIFAAIANEIRFLENHDAIYMDEETGQRYLRNPLSTMFYNALVSNPFGGDMFESNGIPLSAINPVTGMGTDISFGGMGIPIPGFSPMFTGALQWLSAGPLKGLDNLLGGGIRKLAYSSGPVTPDKLLPLPPFVWNMASAFGVDIVNDGVGISISSDKLDKQSAMVLQYWATKDNITAQTLAYYSNAQLEELFGDKHFQWESGESLRNRVMRAKEELVMQAHNTASGVLQAAAFEGSMLPFRSLRVMGTKELSDEWYDYVDRYEGDVYTARDAFIKDHPDVPNVAIMTLSATFHTPDPESYLANKSLMGGNWDMGAGLPQATTEAGKKFYNRPEIQELVQRSPMLLFAVIPSELYKQDFNRAEWNYQISLGMNHTKTPMDFLDSYDLTQGYAAYDAAVARREVELNQRHKELLLDGVDISPSANSAAYEDIYKRYRGEFQELESLYPEWGEFRNQQGGSWETVEQRLAIDKIREGAKLPVVARTNFGKKLNEYFEMRDKVWGIMHHHSIESLDNKWADTITIDGKTSLVDYYTQTVEELSKDDDFARIYAIALQQDLKGIYTKADQITNEMTTEQRDRFREHNIEFTKYMENVKNATTDWTQKPIYDMWNSRVNAYYRDHGEGIDNPIVAWWETRDVREKFDYRTRVATKDPVFWSVADWHLVAKMSHDTDSIDRLAQIADLRTKAGYAKNFEDDPSYTGPEASFYYDQIDALYMDTVENGSDASLAQLQVMGHWGGGFFAATSYDEMDGVEGNLWAGLKGLLETEQSIADSDLANGREPNYTQMRDDVAAYIEDARQNSASFDAHYDMHEGVDRDLLVDHLIPENYYPLFGN